MAKEWHPLKNNNLKPDMFKPGSDHKVWWICPRCGYEYETSIGKRTAKKNPTGCPKCAIEKVTQVKRKAVVMIDPSTNQILKTFISISDASRKLGINGSNITSVCKGIRPLAGGYKWRYRD
nr:zinc-ribbon domain-containing protein [Succinivibrio dextrinosolvens]